MKFLTDRKEIAQEINVKRTPVLTMDISKSMKGYPDCYEGSKVRVLGGYRRYPDMTCECTIRMYGDESGNKDHDHPERYKEIVLNGRNVCLKSDFDLSDVDDMVEWSNTKIVKPGDKVIVFFRGNGVGFLRVMMVSGRINPHCTTVAMLDDVE